MDRPAPGRAFEFSTRGFANVSARRWVVDGVAVGIEGVGDGG